MDVHALRNQTRWHHDETFVDLFFLLFNCSVLVVTIMLGLPGNLWVCWLVFRTKSLQTSNNALLVSLAASDLLKCAVDTPLLLFSFLSYGKKDGLAFVPVPVPVCTLQQFTYALCSCVQLLTLVGISVERFQAIAFPFQTERRRARVLVWIPSIWLCGLVLAAVSLTLSEEALLYMLCRPYVLTEERLQHPDPFGPFVLVPVWFLCIILIVVHYVRIFKVVRGHRKKLFCRGIKLRPTVSEHVLAWINTPNCFPPTPPRRSVILVAQAGSSAAAQEGSGAAPGREAGAPARTGPEIVGAICLMTPGARERGKKHLEGKVAKRFGYIIVAFTLFWAPLVLILLVSAIVWTDMDMELLLELETSAMVLTCMQAAVDPLIYTLVTGQFRSELRKIFSTVPGCSLRRRA